MYQLVACPINEPISGKVYAMNEVGQLIYAEKDTMPYNCTPVRFYVITNDPDDKPKAGELYVHFGKTASGVPYKFVYQCLHPDRTVKDTAGNFTDGFYTKDCKRVILEHVEILSAQFAGVVEQGQPARNVQHAYQMAIQHLLDGTRELEIKHVGHRLIIQLVRNNKKVN